LGTPEREALLLIGDGSAQLTVQELATIAHRHLAPTIVLIDNAGYTVERLILSPDAVYQDVVPWNWTAVAAAFGVPTERIFSVSSPAEMAVALRTADGSAATFIHATLPRDDTPELLLRIARGLR
jgi:indolepyruvate decarboxylase